MPLTVVLVIVVSAWGLLMVMTRLINDARTNRAAARISARSKSPL
jgi:hypothetical protein